MLHLLTEEHKKKVSTEYAYRVGVVVSCAVIVLSAVSFGFLYPTYAITHNGYAEALRQETDITAKIAERQNDTSADSVKGISTSIAALRMFNNETDPVNVVSRVINKKPRGVSIIHVSYQNAGGGKGSPTLNIIGKSDTREHLVTFSQQVRSDTTFVSADVPLSAFAREKDIDFSMKVVVSTSTKNI